MKDVAPMLPLDTKLWEPQNQVFHSFRWHVQNATIPCSSQELLPFLSVMYFFLPPFSTNCSSILSHLILPSISWSTSQSCCSQIHIQYPFGNQRIKTPSLQPNALLKRHKIPCTFWGASSIPHCYVLFPSTLLHQLFFHPLSPHLAIYFLVCLSILLFPDSYITVFRQFYFLPFSVRAQTNKIYLTLLSLL